MSDKSNCEICGDEFEQPRYRTKRTCSTACGKELRTRNMKATYEAQETWIVKVCPGCGEEFKYRRSKPYNTCSVKCRGKMAAQEARAASTCTVCGNEFTHYARQDRNTCSVKCAAIARSSGIHYPECKVCGVSTGSYNRIYCSEHRTSRPGRKPIPRKTAVCQQCKEEFSRPGTWPGQMMFCSLKCSNLQHSRKRAQHYRHGEVNLNSGYEIRFIACLTRLNISWAPWPDDRPFILDGHEYRPDFLVEGLAIETKGWDHPNSPQPRIRDSWDLSEPLVVVDRQRLGELERIFNKNQFLAVLRA